MFRLQSQEYPWLQPCVKWPLGWMRCQAASPLVVTVGAYYCGAREDKSFGRDISDAHLQGLELTLVEPIEKSCPDRFFLHILLMY
uniref:Uncharacterized protein n=1 Tax=Helianthus annuus TaxID=4232 RepID=A0A251RXM4_HELAN